MPISQESARNKYVMHRSRSVRRGIEFKLTFEQWLAVWGDKLDQCGTRAWQLGMCRKNDAGAYEVGNVYLGTPRRNAASKRMALENKRKSESRHCFGMGRKDALILQDDSQSGETDEEHLNYMLGMRSSEIWA